MGLNKGLLFGVFIFVQFNIYAQENKVSLFIAFNQPKYTPGDTAYFSAFLINKSAQPFLINSIIDFRAYNSSGLLVSEFKLSVKSGICINQWVIPKFIDPGLYRIIINLTSNNQCLFKSEVMIVKENEIELNQVITAGLEPSQKLTCKVTGDEEAIPRDSINLTIHLTDSLGSPLIGRCVVTVINESLFGKELPIKLWASEWLNMENEYCDYNNTISSTNENLEIEGVVMSLETNGAVPPGTEVFFFLQKSRWRTQVTISENGYFRLSIPNFYGSDNLFYAAQSKTGKELPILILKQTIAEPNISLIPFQSLPTLDPLVTFMTRKEAIDKTYLFEETVQPITNEFKKSGLSILQELGGSDNEFQIQEYIPFPTMDALILEVIRPLYVYKTKGKKHVFLRYLAPNPATGDPVFIIDGQMTTNTEYFLSLNPMDLVSICLITDPRKLLRLGFLSKNGIVVVQSQSDNLKVPSTNSIPLEGIQPRLDFSVLNYAEIKSDRPQFRSTLHWESVLNLTVDGTEFSFMTSDDLTAFSVVIRGISKNGIPFSEIKHMVIGKR